LTGALAFAGLLSLVPPIPIPGLDGEIPAAVVVFVATFLVVAAVVVLYVLFNEQVRERIPWAKEQWAKVPSVIKAVVVALPIAEVAEFSLALVDVWSYGNEIPTVYRLVVFGLAFVVVWFLTFRHLVARDELSRWNRVLLTGGVIAGGTAVGIVLVDLFVLGSVLPGVVPLAALYLGWPLASFLILRQIRQSEEGFFSVLLVKSGFAQMRQLQTVTVAIAVGFLFALVVGVVLQVVLSLFQVTSVAFLVVWLLGTLAAGWWFDRSITRTDLVVEEVRERSTNRSRELTVTNTGEETIDMREAKIRDTEYDLYRTSMDIVLGAGQTGQFTIPPEFSLYASEHDLGIDLPFGFTISQGADAPVLVTREGVEYELQFEPREDADGDPSDAGTGRGETTSKNA
jgi:F0F1-type ATP synthase assembly protein I